MPKKIENINQNDFYKNESVLKLLKGKKAAKLHSQFSEEEWLSFYEDNSELLENAKSEHIFQEIEARIQQDKRRQQRLRYLGSSVAVLLFLAFGVAFFFKQTEISQIQPSLSVRIKKINVTNHPITLKPGGGNKITLYPGSEISYDSSAQPPAEITLKGKAKFEIVHHKARRFRVFCGDIVTVDLGTVFQIDEFGKDIRVDLYEGEVLVYKVNDSENGVTLFPGEFLVYHHKSNKKLAKALKETPKTPIAGKISATLSETQPVEDKSVMKFKNKNLSTTLDELAMKYNVKINYPTNQAQQLRLNMIIDTTQRIDVILKNIAIVSNLHLSRDTETEFSLTAKKAAKNQSGSDVIIK